VIRCLPALCLAVPLFIASSPAPAADPWADAVVHYDPGSATGLYTTALQSVVGAPERYTGEIGGFPAAVNPFNPAWGWDELLAVGPGGSLTLRFDEPVADDPLNPFGLDLILFANMGYSSDLGFGVTSGSMLGGATAAQIEVSQNGTGWTPLTSILSSSILPTLGYQDITDPFTPPAGTVLTDFTRPVAPGFDAAGMSLAQIIAAYGGAGGGLGLDLSQSGLAWVTHVRITNTGSGDLVIDALADVAAVPAPASLLALLFAIPRRRRVTA
jgi:hypothetical protein